MRRRRGSILAALFIILLPHAQAAAQAPQSAGFAAIQQAFFREDFAAVRASALEFLQSPQPGDQREQVGLWLVLSLHQLGQTQQALEQLDTLMAELDPHSLLWAEAFFWEGEFSRMSGNDARARAAYQRLLDRFPYSSWSSFASLGLGLVYLHYEQYDVADKYFNWVIQDQEYTAAGRQARLYAGTCALKQSDPWGAVRHFKSLLAASTDTELNARASLYLGEALSAAGLKSEAASAYRQALEWAPGGKWAALAGFALGWAAYRDGACGEALERFETYLQSGHPEHREEALFAQGDCLLRGDDQEKAYARLERLVRSAPAHPLSREVGFAVIDRLISQGDTARARELVERMAVGADEETQARIAVQRGILDFDAGAIQQAITSLQLAVHKGGPAIEQQATVLLGDIAAWRRRWEEAEESYLRGIELAADPGETAYARQRYARLLMDLDRAEEARKQMEILAQSKLPGMSDEAALLEGLLAIHAERLDEARGRFERLYRDRAGEIVGGRAAYYLALLGWESAAVEDVRAWIGNAVAWAPQSQEALDARVLNAELDLRSGSAAEVFAALRARFRDEPLSQRSRMVLARDYADLAKRGGRLAEALRWYEKALDFLPEGAGQVLYAAADCYERGGDLDLALQRYRRIEDPYWRVRGLLGAAKLLERDERWNEAVELYARLLQENVAESAIVMERLAAVERELAPGEYSR